MMRAPKGSLGKTRPAREHGRHIFAYCNVSTNQVLYSLHRSLEGNKSLEQLPDAGANNNPPKLRKDVWRPLWSVTLPDGKVGLAQGLSAFERLRKLRRLHELNWKPPSELARPTTQKEMDEIQEELDERGGKKMETVHDIIKRRKKRIRQRMVMDQKANSIADLAAVLIEQDRSGAETMKEQGRLREEERANEVAEMLRLAEEARAGGLERLRSELDALTQRLEAKRGGTARDEQSNRSMSRGINALEKRLRRMQFSLRAVNAVDSGKALRYDDERQALAAEARVRRSIPELKQQIEERRQAEAALMAERIAEMPQDMQLEMRLAAKQELDFDSIRHLLNQPQEAMRLLSGFAAEKSHVDQLQALAQLWQSIFVRNLEASESRLAFLRDLQAAVEAGEDALAKLATEQNDKGIKRLESGEPDFAWYSARSKARSAQIEAMENRLPLLRDVVRLISETSNVEEVESSILEHKTQHPAGQPESTITVYESEERTPQTVDSELAYEYILGKARVEARAVELVEQMGTRAFQGEQAAAEPAELAEPTFGEVREAAKQVQRLTARVRDVEKIEAFEGAVQGLPGGEIPMELLKRPWSKLGAEEQRSKLREYLPQLRDWRPILAQTRVLLAQPNGSERLEKAAEAARERSRAAHHDEEPVEVQQRLRNIAKMYDTIVSLRAWEAVVLRAPEYPVEELAEEAEEELDSTDQEFIPERTGSDSVGHHINSASADRAVSTKPRSSPTDQTAEQSTSNAEAQSARSTNRYHALLPSFPERHTLPKRGLIRNKLIKLRRPIFTAADVVVKWNNILDAEYAEAWPEEVRHEPMGLSRYTAPKVDEEPIFDVAEWKNMPGGGYTGKKFEREMERRRVREEAGGVTARVVRAVVEREARRVAEAKAIRMAKRAERAAMREQGLQNGGEVARAEPLTEGP